MKKKIWLVRISSNFKKYSTNSLDQISKKIEYLKIKTVYNRIKVIYTKG